MAKNIAIIRDLNVFFFKNKTKQHKEKERKENRF